MRQSPRLLALFTLSATLGLASQARGASLPTTAQETDARVVRVAELVESAEKTPELTAIAASSAQPSVASLDEFTTTVRAAAEASPTVADPDAVSAEGDVSAEPVSSLESSTFVSVHQLTQSSAATDRDTLSATAEPSVAQAVEDQPEAQPEDEPELDEEEDVDVGDEGDEVDEAADETADPTSEESDSEAQVLVAEVAVENPAGASLRPDLEDIVYDAVETRPGQTTTRSQIQQDINNVFSTGFFANVRAVPTDTPLGVRVTFVVQPNPVLQDVVIEGNEVLPETEVDDIFAEQYGEIINLLDFQEGILELNEWYQEQGYVLAQVVAAPEVGEDGIVTLQVAEGVIEDIEVRFLTEEGEFEDEEGNPIRGKTREFIITREFETEPGDVFRQSQIQSDLQRVFGLGIFDDVNLTLNPGEKDPRQVRVTVNVVERSTGSVAAGVGFNFTGDLFGTLSYRQDNFGGNNQKFSAETQLSTRDILFDVSFTDPWIGGDPYRTSYTMNGFARRSISLVFEGGPNEIDLANGDRVRVNRFGAGINFRRPLGDGWEGSAGTLYQRVRTTDEDGSLFAEDAAGNPLTVSDTGADDLWTFQVGVVRDLRDNSFAPTSGSVLRLSTEQSVPLGSGNIFMNRVRASYSQYIPVSFLSFNEGPQTIAINVQGGTIIGDLPPYEAFALGGTNSVRGYEEGEVGTGRSYLQASIEYRFPLFSFLGGALFLDAATDIGSGDAVPGSPGPDRGKPGSGFGYGAGVRVQTPLGQIRVDYGFSDQGDGRLHFGIGERF